MCCPCLFCYLLLPPFTRILLYEFGIQRLSILTNGSDFYKIGTEGGIAMVQHDIQNHKFIIDNPEGLSWLEYTEEERSVTVLHTVVPKALSGRGLASQLAAAVMAYTQSQSKGILSECSYMTAWLKRHSGT